MAGYVINREGGIIKISRGVHTYEYPLHMIERITYERPPSRFEQQSKRDYNRVRRRQ